MACKNCRDRKIKCSGSLEKRGGSCTGCKTKGNDAEMCEFLRVECVDVQFFQTPDAALSSGLKRVSYDSVAEVFGKPPYAQTSAGKADAARRASDPSTSRSTQTLSSATSFSHTPRDTAPPATMRLGEGSLVNPSHLFPHSQPPQYELPRPSSDPRRHSVAGLCSEAASYARPMRMTGVASFLVAMPGSYPEYAHRLPSMASGSTSSTSWPFDRRWSISSAPTSLDQVSGIHALCTSSATGTGQIVPTLCDTSFGVGWRPDSALGSWQEQDVRSASLHDSGSYSSYQASYAMAPGMAAADMGWVAQ
ncbi:Hypothetical protein D9617_28g064950 [Elsinoe fawcettii]|nr:Hypothetical protein D9617_28g064950 [Elsinoe fawcettii]